ncbi:MAG TPA: carboxypeptidase-like regulatory domain-containing protein, partial [Blastocatellia bacterium]|nr:carboxypeptidase-like regulatory domain-containing protein [Blastocatellia bacterium]
MKGRLGLAVFSAIMVLACVSPALAQVTALAQLNGAVRDENGAIVAKATITLREESTNRSYAVVSNEAGFYLVPNLPPGHYQLTAESTGFGKYTQAGIALSVGQVATIDITLRVQAVTGEVTINT